MADSKTAVQLLEELRKERQELDALIQALEKRLGINASTIHSDSDVVSAPKSPSLDSIPIGFFHNLSQAAAAEKLLRLNPMHPLTTGEFIEAFKKSGMELNPKNAVTILYTALKRSPRFERVGSKAWGLAEWYPQRSGAKKPKEDQDEMSLNDALSELARSFPPRESK